MLYKDQQLTYFSAVNVANVASENFQGSASWPNLYNYLEPAFASDQPVYEVQQQCTSNSSFSVALQESSITLQQGRKILSLLLFDTCEMHHFSIYRSGANSSDSDS